MTSDQKILLNFRAHPSDRENRSCSRKKPREWNYRMLFPAIQCVSAIFQF
ncbi:MAG: hypothetical protein HW377_2819, partial [Actinobacteria bacterium]|nr:hypothetical protein [Actinomycetota bacterium]